MAKQFSDTDVADLDVYGLQDVANLLNANRQNVAQRLYRNRKGIGQRWSFPDPHRTVGDRPIWFGTREFFAAVDRERET